MTIANISSRTRVATFPQPYDGDIGVPYTGTISQPFRNNNSNPNLQQELRYIVNKDGIVSFGTNVLVLPNTATVNLLDTICTFDGGIRFLNYGMIMIPCSVNGLNWDFIMLARLNQNNELQFHSLFGQDGQLSNNVVCWKNFTNTTGKDIWLFMQNVVFSTAFMEYYNQWS